MTKDITTPESERTKKTKRRSIIRWLIEILMGLGRVIQKLISRILVGLDKIASTPPPSSAGEPFDFRYGHWHLLR